MEDIFGNELKVGDIVSNCVIEKSNKIRETIGVIVKLNRNSLYTNSLPDDTPGILPRYLKLEEWMLNNCGRGSSLFIRIGPLHDNPEECKEWLDKIADKIKQQIGGRSKVKRED